MRTMIIAACIAAISACNCSAYPRKEAVNDDTSMAKQADALVLAPVSQLPIKEAVSALPLAEKAAENAVEKPVDLAALKIKVGKTLPFSIDKVLDTPLPGVYAVLAGAQVFYTDAEGVYVLDGTLYDMSAGPKNAVNLSDEMIDREQGPKRVARLDALGEDKMIVFKAPEEKHVVTVFTDIDCGYCRKFHREVAQLNELGVTVRYVGFPRAGLGSPSFNKLASVWCSADPKAAMNHAKASGDFDQSQVCDSNPIGEHYSIVKEFGLRGTPAIVLENGRLMPGYMPADRLFAELNKGS